MRNFNKLFILLIVVFSLSGCLSLGQLFNLGSEGYQSEEGQQAGVAAQTIATPLVGQPLATIIAGAVSLLAGGFAVYKRQKYLDTPPKSKS